MTDLQLECMKLGASKELSFGCLVSLKYNSRRVKRAKILAHMGGGEYRVMERIDSSTNKEELEKDYGHCEFRDYEKDSFETIGHPITRGRLCYLNSTKQVEELKKVVKSDYRLKLKREFDKLPELYNQDTLTRQIEIQLLVRDFLLSIQ